MLPFTSRKLKMVFQKLNLHPYDKYPEYYSTENPLTVISYSWDVCLLTELPYFVLRFEQMVGQKQYHLFDRHFDERSDLQS